MRASRILLLLLLLPLGGCNRKGEEEPFLVGHVAPFSGRDQWMGEHTQRGMRLALASANESLIAGRRVAVVHADSHGEPGRAREEAVRLASVNKVLALLGGETDTVDRLSTAVQPYSLPLLTPVSVRNSAGQEGVFSLDVTPDYRGEILARFAAEELKVNKQKAERAVVLLDDNRPVCAAIASSFVRTWRADDSKKTVQTHNYDPKEDKKTLTARLREAQVVVFAGSAKDFSQVRGVLESEKLTPALLFAGEAAEWARLAADTEKSRDIYAASLYATKGLTSEGEQFVKDYRKEYKEAPDLFAFQGYELATVIVEVLRETRGVGGAKLREEMDRDRDFPGVTGKFVFKDGHAVRTLFILRGGQEEPVKVYRPKST